MSDQDENHLIAERRAKLAKLRERGIAFPNDFRRNALAADLLTAYGGKSPEALAAGEIRVSVAGRLRPPEYRETHCASPSCRETCAETRVVRLPWPRGSHRFRSLWRLRRPTPRPPDRSVRRHRSNRVSGDPGWRRPVRVERVPCPAPARAPGCPRCPAARVHALLPEDARSCCRNQRYLLKESVRSSRSLIDRLI